jgi:anti-sigma regulatory factor (Ser/Thr protein kinase)
MADRIRLTVPRVRTYFGVAHLVLGGVAMRQNLTLEALEDLQIALAEVLAREHGDGAVTLELELNDGSLETRIGPFVGSVLRADLEPAGERQLGLRRVLDSTVDGVEVETRPDGDWVLLTKAVDT